MKSILTDVRARIVLRLQSERGHALPGSNREKIAEHAIDLCLNSGRAAASEAHLYHNVMRDARKHILRSRDREWLANARALTMDGYSPEPTEVVGYAKLSPSAEDVCLNDLNPLFEVARTAALEIGPWGTAFLDHLLAGRSVGAAAAQVGIARATGYRARESLAAALEPHTAERGHQASETPAD
ncbi:hypothetical protein [Paenarthrobacter ureafaciens]|uniref:hypothetical protein n=1 Tax=Paenarthrobacter ureafaciens TaxID=37931 RepID=UPI00140D5B66|nr:hypothetical protein [Paenarthrobacter ureafaciens]MCX8453056.1 hypothetical protein [Paenarthrobacter ureafaciens]MCY0972272.1 hypothetical protein [Paenarthrobacter ureafaciens]